MGDHGFYYCMNCQRSLTPEKTAAFVHSFHNFCPGLPMKAENGRDDSTTVAENGRAIGSHKFVYIAGPYTIGDVAENVREAILAAEEVAFCGHVPIIPHLSHLWHLVIPHDYEFWCELTMRMLDRCDALVRLPGESRGADKEIERALELNLPVFYGIEECIAWLPKKNVTARGGTGGTTQGVAITPDG